MCFSQSLLLILVLCFFFLHLLLICASSSVSVFPKAAEPDAQVPSGLRASTPHMRRATIRPHHLTSPRAHTQSNLDSETERQPKFFKRSICRAWVPTVIGNGTSLSATSPQQHNFPPNCKEPPDSN